MVTTLVKPNLPWSKRKCDTSVTQTMWLVSNGLINMSLSFYFYYKLKSRRQAKSNALTLVSATWLPPAHTVAVRWVAAVDPLFTAEFTLRLNRRNITDVNKTYYLNYLAADDNKTTASWIFIRASEHYRYLLTLLTVSTRIFVEATSLRFEFMIILAMDNHQYTCIRHSDRLRIRMTLRLSVFVFHCWSHRDKTTVRRNKELKFSHMKEAILASLVIIHEASFGIVGEALCWNLRSRRTTYPLVILGRSHYLCARQFNGRTTGSVFSTIIQYVLLTTYAWLT